jgi:hypothetical protein
MLLFALVAFLAVCRLCALVPGLTFLYGDDVVCILASLVLDALLSLPPVVIPLGLVDVILLLHRCVTCSELVIKSVGDLAKMYDADIRTIFVAACISHDVCMHGRVWTCHV